MEFIKRKVLLYFDVIGDELEDSFPFCMWILHWRYIILGFLYFLVECLRADSDVPHFFSLALLSVGPRDVFVCGAAAVIRCRPVSWWHPQTLPTLQCGWHCCSLHRVANLSLISLLQRFLFFIFLQRLCIWAHSVLLVVFFVLVVLDRLKLL